MVSVLIPALQDRGVHLDVSVTAGNVERMEEDVQYVS